MKHLVIFGSVVAVSLLAAPVSAQTLEQLLEQTRREATQTQQLNREREAEFQRNRDRQQALLEEARAELQRQEARSDQLREAFDANETALVELETTLDERLGNLGELFGVVRQTAEEFRGKAENSLVSAQITDRMDFLEQLGQRKALPSIRELNRLWFELQREITEQGKVVTFQAPVLNVEGRVVPGRTVTRVGVFTAVEDDRFLVWSPPSPDHEDGILQILPRQPASRFRSMADNWTSTQTGYAPMALDFTSGQILRQVVQTPDLEERVRQGGAVGYVIIALGALGLLIALWRAVVLFWKGFQIKGQLRKDEASTSNALGRVMAVYNEDPNVDVETLELKLDEAILRETSAMERGLSFLKMLYVIAPLLGLLGTVVGMISTFQAITLFGTGDPKMMAGGISQALVTTVLGLIVAIPLTFLHSILQSRARHMIHILEEQAAGLVARLAERRDDVVV